MNNELHFILISSLRNHSSNIILEKTHWNLLVDDVGIAGIILFMSMCSFPNRIHNNK